LVFPTSMASNMGGGPTLSAAVQRFYA
jgi:hypothetical protein